MTSKELRMLFGDYRALCVAHFCCGDKTAIDADLRDRLEAMIAEREDNLIREFEILRVEAARRNAERP